MKSTNITFNDLPDALATIILKQTEILDALEKQKTPVHAPKEILTIQEAAELLDINRSTLWKWEKVGKVKSYGIEKRRYYKRSEIIDSLTPLN